MSVKIDWTRIQSRPFLEDLQESLNRRISTDLIQNESLWNGGASPLSKLQIDKIEFPDHAIPIIEIVEMCEPLEMFHLSAAFSPEDCTAMEERLNISTTSQEIDDERKHGILDNPEDFQIVLLVKGDLGVRLEISAELGLMQPVPMFISLPLKATVHSLRLDGRLVYARVGGQQYLSLLPKFNLDMSLETEIGDAQIHVLRNVSKVERFLKDQLLRILQDRLVYPSHLKL